MQNIKHHVLGGWESLEGWVAKTQQPMSLHLVSQAYRKMRMVVLQRVNHDVKIDIEFEMDNI